MKIFTNLALTSLFIFNSYLFAAPLKEKREKKIDDAKEALLSLDCPFLLLTYNPKDEKQTPLGLCVHTQTETRGIFEQSACVAVLIESKSKVSNPFYGSKGHWGVEGKCTKEKIQEKMKSKDIETTVNPFTSTRMKREQGEEVVLLRDEFQIWDRVKVLIEPKKTLKK